MTLLSYQIFKTVAEAGSFHKAADLLGLTPSAISHAISSMEKELGFSVLARSRAGVTLTNYGEHLLPYVNAVLNSDESLQQVVAEFNGMKQGTVKVGCFSSACTSFMPEVIKSFRKQYPAIRIEVFEGTYDDVSYWIKNGIVDFGFLSASSAGDLKLEIFYKDPLVCVVPKDYRKTGSGDSITVEEICCTAGIDRCGYSELHEGKRPGRSHGFSCGGRPGHSRHGGKWFWRLHHAGAGYEGYSL